MVSRLISASLFEGLVVRVDIPISEAIRIRLEAVFTMALYAIYPTMMTSAAAMTANRVTIAIFICATPL